MDKYFQSPKIRTKNAYNIMKQMIADYIHGMEYASTGCINSTCTAFSVFESKGT